MYEVSIFFKKDTEERFVFGLLSACLEGGEGAGVS